jgi:hypothetical protein
MNGFRREIQHGPPLQVGGREIVTEAEVWSFQAKQMSLQDSHAAGGGALFMWARPTAIVERNAGAEAALDTESRTPVTDVNLQLEIALLIAAVILPIVLTIFTTWARRSAKSPDELVS